MRVRHAVGALFAVVVACTEATPPARATSYSFTIDCAVPDVCTSAADSALRLIFRWSPDALPVRVWVEPMGDLPLFVQRGMAAWEQTSLYGEFRTLLVGDSASADVIVALGTPETATGDTEMAPLDCRGQTDIQIGLDTAIILPFRVTLVPRLGASGTEVDACYHTVALHEMGHAFGLLLHSDETTDVMHARPTVTLLSRRDIATFVQLYHTTPTVRLPPER